MPPLRMNKLHSNMFMRQDSLAVMSCAGLSSVRVGDDFLMSECDFH